jgi:hypothetical protein
VTRYKCTVSRMRCSVLHDAPQSRDPQNTEALYGPRISSASLRAAQHPGNAGASDAVSEVQFVSQIAPIRVELLDQSDLPGAAPALQGMFSRASFEYGIERFKINELIDFVFACETGNELGLMF